LEQTKCGSLVAPHCGQTERGALSALLFALLRECVTARPLLRLGTAMSISFPQRHQTMGIFLSKTWEALIKSCHAAWRPFRVWRNSI
jgi:hypothetical protein